MSSASWWGKCSIRWASITNCTRDGEKRMSKYRQESERGPEPGLPILVRNHPRTNSAPRCYLFAPSSLHTPVEPVRIMPAPRSRRLAAGEIGDATISSFEYGQYVDGSSQPPEI